MIQPVVWCQDSGEIPSASELWKIIRTGSLMRSHALISISFLIWSGPAALLSWSSRTALSTLLGALIWIIVRGSPPWYGVWSITGPSLGMSMSLSTVRVSCGESVNVPSGFLTLLRMPWVDLLKLRILCTLARVEVPFRLSQNCFQFVRFAWVGSLLYVLFASLESSQFWLFLVRLALRLRTLEVCLAVVSSAVHQGTEDRRIPRVMGQAELKLLRRMSERNCWRALRSVASLTDENQKGCLSNSAATSWLYSFQSHLDEDRVAKLTRSPNPSLNEMASWPERD